MAKKNFSVYFNEYFGSYNNRDRFVCFKLSYRSRDVLYS